MRISQIAGVIFLAVLIHLMPSSAQARVRGECANCHTMHNSQNGSSMAWDGSVSPSEYLTRGDCVACHAQNTASRIITLGVSEIPQVLHTDTSDLAGGNFRYLTDNDNRGHNVVDLGNLDDTFLASANGIPGGIREAGHQGLTVSASDLTCAGANGCHGIRNPGGPSGVGSLAGSHHNDVEGQCDVADAPYNSYRFLTGVKGYENQIDKWQNINSTSHNEYSGITAAPSLGCSALSCHNADSSLGITPPTGTISGFCATCHGNFHTLRVGTGDDTMGNSSGIGDDTLSPFIRHPTDIVIKNEGEYAFYTTYNVNAPVGRTTGVPAAPSNIVTPGSDVVTCLSCHMSHASNNPDMLRWDYTGMLAHNSSADTGNGCFICHTTKDDY